MNTRILTLTVLLVTTLLAGTALAHRYGGGMMGGGMMGSYGDDDYGYCYRYDASREDVKAITGKYADQFDALDQKMAAKRDEIRKARSNDATTVGQLNKLRDEMLSIRKDYRDLRTKVDGELTAKFGEPDDSDYGMHRGRHHRGGMMGSYDDDDNERGRGYGYGGCRW